MSLAKRKKLMALYGGLGLLVTAMAAGAAIWLERTRSPSASDYRPGEDVEGITSSLSRNLPEDRPAVTFQDATETSGISFRHFGGSRSTQLPEDMGSGVAIGDYDNDGLPDVFLVNIAAPLTPRGREGATRATNRLYRNEGNARFVDVSAAAGVDAAMTGMGAAFGDFDGDGLLDLVVTGFSELVLYRNVEGKRFEDVSRAAGLSELDGFWTGASWGDYDGDGDLDLYICGYVRYAFRAEDASRGTRQYQAVVPYTLNPSSYPPERNLLFRNDGGGRFTEVGESTGVHNPEGRSLAASWCDFDEDGDLDLYVANDVSDNVLYRNAGDGTFEDVSHGAWVADYRGAMGLAVGDWDLDSDQDLFVTHWIAQENALYSNLEIAFGASSDSEELRFMDVADTVGLGQIALDYVGWGTFFFDYDNDGRPDLFVAQGSTFQDDEDPGRLVPMTSALFWNGGVERGFFDLAPVSGEALGAAHVTRGAASADLDQDGDLDLVLVNHGADALLFRNDGGNDKAWLHVELRSKSANRFGLGAKVSVLTGETSQTIHIGAQASYLSQLPYAAHFGLGQHDKVDRLTVQFPGGARVVRENVAARQRIVIEEPP